MKNRRHFIKLGVSSLALAPLAAAAGSLVQTPDQTTGPGGNQLATQLYIQGDPGLERDGVFRSIKGEERRASVQAAFRPNPDDSAELLAEWDVVIA